MGDVDESSKLLGELVASVESLRNQARDQWRDLEALKEEIHEANVLNRALAKDLSTVSLQVEKMVPVVEDYKRMKQRGITVIVMIGLLSGGLGVVGAKISEFFFGG